MKKAEREMLYEYEYSKPRTRWMVFFVLIGFMMTAFAGVWIFMTLIDLIFG